MKWYWILAIVLVALVIGYAIAMAMPARYVRGVDGRLIWIPDTRTGGKSPWWRLIRKPVQECPDGTVRQGSYCIPVDATGALPRCPSGEVWTGKECVSIESNMGYRLRKV